MTTPTAMTSMIITATAMMTTVVPSLGGLLVGGMLLLMTVTVVIIAPSLPVGRVMWLTGTVVVVSPCLVRIVMGCILLLIGTVSDKVYALLLMVGCLLLQTETVAVVETAPKLVSSGIDAVESENIISAWHVVASVLCTVVLRSMVCPCCALALSIT